VREDTQSAATVRREDGRTAALDFDRVVVEQYDAVYRFCARRVGVQRAADAAQETFLTAHKAIKRFRGDSAMLTWVLGIAHNECRRMARRDNFTPLPLELGFEQGTGDSEGVLVNRQILNEALAKLSQEHRDAVILHELDGLTYEEAGHVLGVPEGTVKSRLHHAFLQLRKIVILREEVST
jgi:RNA polymerase sigma-70 factor (ECF subfamily)